ncbi:MAG: hypothetical protein CBE00_07375 [Planctomycetaceae bacterium TMED240]|nr:MAG: hypothetical protein CBE00_07375 [Planctomycetaceae bacterium TMED240]
MIEEPPLVRLPSSGSPFDDELMGEFFAMLMRPFLGRQEITLPDYEKYEAFSALTLLCVPAGGQQR